MSINSNPTGQNSSAKTEQRAAQQASGTSGSFQSNANFGGDLFANAITNNLKDNVSEALTTYVENVNKYLETAQTKTVKFKSFLIDEPDKAACPLVVIVGTPVTGTGSAVVKVQLLEAGLYQGEIQAVYDTSNNQNIKVRRTIGNAVDDALIALVTQRLESEGYKTPFITGFAAVYEETPLNESYTARLFTSSDTMAIANQIDGSGSLTIQQLTENKKVRLHSIGSITPGATTESLTGLPVATDFSFVVQARLAGSNQNRESMNGGDQSIMLCNAQGIVDLLPVRTRQNPNAFGNAPMHTGFKPMVVLTEISGLTENSSGTYEDMKTTFLALAAISPMLDDSGQWKEVFNKAGNSKASVAALGYVHNPIANDRSLPGLLSVAATHGDADSKKQSPLDIMADFVEDGQPFIAIDVAQCGRISWSQRALVAASKGSTDANTAIIRELDIQTNGRFSTIYGNKPVTMVGHNCVIHMGYSEDEEGNLTDIRSIDAMAVLEWSKGDLQTYTNSIIRPASNNKAAIETRYEILDSMVNVKLKGWAERIVMAPDFMPAYLQALQESGLALNSEGLKRNEQHDATIGMSTSGWAKNFSNSVHQQQQNGNQSGQFQTGGFGQQYNF